MTEITEWFEQHDGEEISVYVEGGRVFLVTHDNSEEHGPDGDAYYLHNVSGEVRYPGR